MSQKANIGLQTPVMTKPPTEKTYGHMNFTPHMQRTASLGEIHARPHPSMTSQSVILHLAFMTEGGQTVDHAILSDLCQIRGVAAPGKQARYHEMAWGKGHFRWERHSEFSTYSYDAPAAHSFGAPIFEHPFSSDFKAPGSFISGTRIEIKPLTAANKKQLGHFDPQSLCVELLNDGKSLVATDFRQDQEGLTVFLILEANLDPLRIGFFAKSIIDMDTYRTLAMLGLPLAQSLSSKLNKTELELARLTASIRDAKPEQGQSLLEEITALAAELEADAAASLFRFGASRAYGLIINERIDSISGAEQLDGKQMGVFLRNRLSPALRTCQSVEDRQSDLSRKLSRAANLLRTRIEVEIEQQNRSVLKSMNRRAKLQLRLQQTVEGLSVAAVSYYLVGLFYYLAQAVASYLPDWLSPKVATGLFVPVAIFFVWWTVRRIRRNHSE